MSAEPWRVLDVDGAVVVIPTPEAFGEGRWRCRGNFTEVLGSSPRRAVIKYAAEAGLAPAEIRGPGELLTFEQVAAERERCLGWAEVVRESAKSELRRLLTPEDAAHFGGAVIGARSVALGIEMGNPIPLKVTP